MLGEMVSTWLRYADMSYIATRLLWFTDVTLDSAVYSHRTIELYVKAFLVSRGVQVKPRSAGWGHNLVALGQTAAKYDAGFSSEPVSRRLKVFERYFDDVRYPGSSAVSDDGGLIWLAFDATIAPLDEFVAFVRPRICLEPEDWRRSTLHALLRSDIDRGSPLRALTDANVHLAIIDCLSSRASVVEFAASFNYDRRGC